MARQTNNDNKVRLNLTMSPQVKLKLDEIVERTQADSMSEVVRRSLAIYDFLLKENSNGFTIAILKSDTGKEKEVEFFLQ